MSIVLITGSNGLVGSESAFFFLKKVLEKNFLEVMEIHCGYKKNLARIEAILNIILI